MTKQLAELIHAIKFEQTLPTVLHKTKLCILDYIADTIAGIESKLPSVEIILKHVISKAGNGEATIIGDLHGDLESLAHILSDSLFLKKVQVKRMFT